MHGCTTKINDLMRPARCYLLYSVHCTAGDGVIQCTGSIVLLNGVTEYGGCYMTHNDIAISIFDTSNTGPATLY